MNQNRTSRAFFLYYQTGSRTQEQHGLFEVKVCKLNRIQVGVLVGPTGPKSTAMVIAGRSVHLTTLFPVQA